MPKSSSNKSHSSSSEGSKFVTIGEVIENTNTQIDGPKITTQKLKNLLDNLRSGQKLFLFTFMIGCGHCDNAKPAWKELSVIKKNGVTIAMLNQELLDKSGILKILQLDDIDEKDEEKIKEKEQALEMLKELVELTGPAPTGFPNFKVVSGTSKKVEEYDGDRTMESFKKWIEKNSGGSSLMGGSNRRQMGGSRLRRGSRKTKKGRKIGKKNISTLTRMLLGGRKWSRKYKKSINCKRPKGFSQKQYCKYGRK